MTFGLKETGFDIMTFDDIVTEMKNTLIEEFQGIEELDLSDQSVNSHWINVMSKPQADFWERMNEVYNSQSPSNSEGVSFDDIAQYIGLQRLEAKASLVPVGINGTEGTVIEEGKQVTNTVNNEIFRFNSDYTITSLNINNIYYKVDEILDSTAYTVITTLGTITFTSGVSATIEQITQGLIDAANAESFVSTSRISNINDTIIIVFTGYLSINSFTSNLLQFNSAFVESLKKEPISAVAGSITDIIDGVSGFDAINNFLDGRLGNDTETTAAFKIRRENSLSAVGAGTLPSMIARMQDDVEGVTLVSGFENRTKVVDSEGRPASSFELLIEGGADAAIGQQIWDTKPAGIEPFSRTGDSYDVIDSNGDTQRMFWTRPTTFTAYVRVTLTYNTEEVFPPNGIQDIKDNILEYGNSIAIGKDYIGDKFKCQVQKTAGVKSSIIEFSNDGVIWETDFFEVSSFERGLFDLTRILVS